LAREAVRKSLVLLKNGKSSSAPLLPLPKKAGKILVAGSHANDLGNQCGGWTITWQGSSGNTTVGEWRLLFRLTCSYSAFGTHLRK
jgi:beta-glucosidase-like glycosyl hydrolase